LAHPLGGGTAAAAIKSPRPYSVSGGKNRRYRPIRTSTASTTIGSIQPFDQKYLIRDRHRAKRPIVDATTVPALVQHNSRSENEGIKAGKTPARWQE
jgi:hypothetical protein